MSWSLFYVWAAIATNCKRNGHFPSPSFGGPSKLIFPVMVKRDSHQRSYSKMRAVKVENSKMLATPAVGDRAARATSRI